MNENPDFQTMALLFRRQSLLPSLPTSVLKLIQQIDEGAASATLLEQTICSDTALAANFMRLGNCESGERGGKLGNSVKSMVILLGQKTVRRIAVSLLLLNSLSGSEVSPWFNRNLCSQHCIFVARLAKHLLNQKQKSVNNVALTWGDAFSAGILHELPIWALARACPGSFNRVFIYAQRHSITFSESFKKLYGTPISKLGTMAIQSWGLPEEYSDYFTYADEPWLANVNYDLICAIVYADHLSQRTPYKLEPWEAHPHVALEVTEAMPFSQAELDLAIEEISASMAEMAQVEEEIIRVSRRSVSVR